MRDVERKKVATAKDAGKAMEIFTKPRTTLPTFNKRYNNLGHLMIDQPQTTWNPEGTHLEQAPSYAFTAPRYSASDMGLLAQRLRHAEEEVLMREESCRVCEETFMKRSNGKDLVNNFRILYYDLSLTVAGSYGRHPEALSISSRGPSTTLSERGLPGKSRRS